MTEKKDNLVHHCILLYNIYLYNKFQIQSLDVCKGLIINEPFHVSLIMESSRQELQTHTLIEK